MMGNNFNLRDLPNNVKFTSELDKAALAGLSEAALASPAGFSSFPLFLPFVMYPESSSLQAEGMGGW